MIHIFTVILIAVIALLLLMKKYLETCNSTFPLLKRGVYRQLLLLSNILAIKHIPPIPFWHSVAYLQTENNIVPFTQIMVLELLPSV